MAHYRRREWIEAREYFTRLKEIAPERRGVDALLNEIDIFVQLQEMQPQEEGISAEYDELATKPREEATVAPRPGYERGVQRRSFGRLLVVALVAIIGLLLTLYATGVLNSLMGNQRQARVQAFVNQGRAAMNVGDYDRAVSAFGEALALAPNNEDVKTWYAKARRFEQLASWYAEAGAAIAAGEWDTALEALQEISALDPTYQDVAERTAFVKGRQAQEALFDRAKGHLDEGEWDQAIATLAQVHDQDSAFRATEVAQSLFYAHFQKGVDLLMSAGGSLELIGQAVQSFDNALELFPDDDTALEEKQLADLYRQGLRSVNQEDWPQAVSALQQIHQQRPDYMSGRVSSLLCTSHLRLGDAYQAAGDLAQALEQYQNVLAIDGCDHVEAAIKERDVYLSLYPPTPTPTPTPMPTRTPLPTPTPTATEVPTPVPTAPPPPPPPPTPKPSPPPR
jgi:tetratricopeptide (TPR) repeat protein